MMVPELDHVIRHGGCMVPAIWYFIVVLQTAVLSCSVVLPGPAKGCLYRLSYILLVHICYTWAFFFFFRKQLCELAV